MLLFFVFRLYGFAYFWVDDFNVLHWIQEWSFLDGVLKILSPSAEHFRPVGVLVYDVAFNLFDLDSRLYHWLAWTIHSLNVALVYVVLKRMTGSRSGAAVGALWFACTPVFNDIFFTFGTIFDLTALPLFLVGMLLWQWERRSLALVFAVSAVFVLAIKSKEMAITLPAVLLAQDLLLRRPLLWKETAAVLVPGGAGLWFGLQKLLQMQETNPGDPYYMDLRGIVMGRGFSFYFDSLFDLGLRWQVWSIAFVAVLLVFLVLRRRLAAFFQIYVFVTFLPVIFLVNHRFAFYWYLPMVGVCGLAALVVKAATEKLLQYLPPERAVPYACVTFALLCAGNYVYFEKATEGSRNFGQKVAADFRALIESLQALPPPGRGETIFFNSLPEYFDEGLLQNAVQLALRRDDVGVRVVKEFPSEARYRLELENARAVMPR